MANQHIKRHINNIIKEIKPKNLSEIPFTTTKMPAVERWTAADAGKHVG